MTNGHIFYVAFFTDSRYNRNVKYARIYKEEEMEAYTSFAEVYDTFMDNVPYEEWADYLEDRLKEYGIRDGLVLELGCGTGSMTELLAEKGYDMIGVDNSEDMLEIAM